MKEKLVLVGNGMAGVRTLEELLKIEPDLYDITVFGSEPHGNYNRILLSPVLAGEKEIGDIMLNDENWYQENNIKLHTGKEVVEIDRRNRKVIAEDGTTASYNRLLLATGSNSVLIPIPGNDLKGVATFRNIHDVTTMLEIAKKKKQALVIGGGLLGLEAAYALKQQGMFVTVVHLMDSLMERQLDLEASSMLKRTLENRGIQFLMETATEALLGEDEVYGARFKGGLEIAADLVVMAVGIRPNIDLARKARIHCDRGIVVNDTMQTYDGRVYAVGECVQHRDQVYGLVAPLFEQAKVCANHLAQLGFAQYRGSLTFSKLKVTGVDLFSTGDFMGDDTTESIVMKDVDRGIYKKIVLKNNRIHGAVMFGDTVDGSWYYQMLRDQTDISGFRGQLLYGQSHLGDSGHGGANTAADMADDVEVCGCNGVCKKDIVNAITSKGLFTLDDVRDHTKASSSCGSCTGLVEQILTFTLGGDYSEAPTAKPLCKCTDYTHEEIRQTIQRQKLMSIRSVMDYLEYRAPDGCHVCRPAINYYLMSSWPGEVVDDPRSRYINERAHANIQKDGTYSVIPRIWGGLVTPAELRAIADAADKFNVSTVKITGGQRIGLYGLKKHELPAVWSDLNQSGMPSGYAYGKSLRTVKTCVGKEWCRFGTQDSTSMGVRLEKLTWGSWMPHKFKMAVSGCPRNCAEATIKDFGVVAVESGWELHIGGNGGVRVRPTELLCKVKTDQEVVEHCCAFIQLYREDAHYLERTAPWIERVGMVQIRQQLIEDGGNRKALSDRFLSSQKFAQKDPWAERTGDAGFETHEFIPLEVKVNHE
ncbi:MAG: nitrite reductase large subunit NirB [Nitrospinaceae bacterium]|nr:nitrite reductase large subunit NirB [Nitrospinaceae bacterium]